MTITSQPTRTGTAKRGATVLIWLLILPTLLWAVTRTGGWERGPAVQLFAFTPYVAAAAWLPVLLALTTKRWLAAAVAAIAAALLAAAVLPRSLADDDRGPETGVTLNVLTSNMLFGSADPDTIVRLVREHDVAVLAVQEFTPEGRAALAAAGLTALLPYEALAPEDDTTGSGVYSRYPVTNGGSRRNGGGFLQAYATIRPPGAGPLTVESAHPLAPAAPGMLKDWRADLAAQFPADPAAPPRILLGDFNATLDHRPLRELIARGYRDAADVTGAGLAGTWGPYDGTPLPPVTIDHVLVDRRIGVRDTRVHDMPRSDHRAVFASLVVPAA